MSFRFRRRVFTAGPSSVATLAIPTSTSLPQATVGSVYLSTLSAAGGTPPYTFAALTTLPPGLTVQSTGSVGGTPSTVVSVSFTVEATDASGSTASQQFFIDCISSGATEPLGLLIANSTGAPQGVVGSSYTLQINSTGGEAPYSTFAVIGGAVPDGLTLNSTTGELTGTPSTTGVSTFTIQVKDSVGSSARQSFRLNVISSQADTTGHAYYNSLLSHGNFYRSFSMRSNSTVDTVINTLTSTEWTYTWPNDNYHSAKDAIKLTINPHSKPPDGSESIKQKLLLPIGLSTGSIFLTWDTWIGPEWKNDRGGVATFKTWQVVADAESTNQEGAIYCELRHLWKQADGSTEVATHNFRSYQQSTVSTLATFVPGLKSFDAYAPTGLGTVAQDFRVKHSIWTRYWVECQLSVPGDQFTDWMAASTASTSIMTSTMNFRMISVWVADEVTDPQRILYKTPWRVRYPTISKCRWQWNTSSEPSSGVGDPEGFAGTMYSYHRNVVMLRDATISDSDTSIFKRPVP